MKRVLLWGLLVPILLRRLIPGWLLESPVILAARHPWIALACAAMGVAIGGLVVAASGVIPMKASTGHWPVTARFLHFAMRQSVVTHAAGIAVPPLADDALVARGAAHYELACRACHGGAAGEVPMIPAGMIPTPRALAVHAADWRPRELFYIVKHGMKFTAMPPWPAPQRDDEVWAMVAFVGRLPSLDRGEYDRLARGGTSMPLDLLADLQPPDVVRSNCGRCHGVDGNSRGTRAFPRLAGQRAEYIERALRAYADGRRYSGIMGPIAAALTPEARRDAAGHYASLAPLRTAPPAGDVSEGRAIAMDGRPDQRIPACTECHGPAATPKNPAYPRLAGQLPEYLVTQLRLLRDRRRGGSEYVHLMHEVASQLTDEQIAAVARYYAATVQ